MILLKVMMSNPLQDFIKQMHISRTFSDLAFPVRRRKKSKVSKRTLKHYTWDASDNMFNLPKLMKPKMIDNTINANPNSHELYQQDTPQHDQKIFLGVSDIDDLITAELLKRRFDTNQRTIHRETTVLCNREQWAEWAEARFPNDLYIQGNSSNGVIIEAGTNNFSKFDVNSNSTTVRAFGDKVYADCMITLIEASFDVVTSHIEWVYGSDGNSVNVPLNRDRLPVDEMYPFLNGELLNDYYERYMASSANILLLIGPPGTGKTSFIRGLLAHTNSSAIVSYDSAILEKDGFFARFIESDDNVMVLEDSDAFLKSRSDGNSVNVPLNRDRLPVEEMYPFLNGESLNDYYDRYMASSANILLLIGPPGTGKTTFIRGLLAHRSCSAIVTYDAGILEKDGFFARFIEDDAEVMVLEDSDAFLKSRSDGNTMMHRFLNVGDGLVTTKGKKMIFSTNLPSIRDIDSALVRPGRCFDILTFDALSQADADKLAVKLGVEVDKDKKYYSLAEIFNKQTHAGVSSANRKVGFI
jgi:guanylate kinase